MSAWHLGIGIVLGLALVVLPACGDGQPAQVQVDESTIPITHPTGSTFEIPNPGGGTPIKVEVVAAANGRLAKRDRDLVMDYVGRLESGKEFDSSKKKGRSAMKFRPGVAAEIQGVDLAALQMRQGDHWKVTIPPELAYGPNGGPHVPANSTVIMELWLTKVE